MVSRPSTITSLSELTALLDERRGLFIRWSRDLERDEASGCSRDSLTGAALPGLSANPLDVEDWWGDRPVRLWAARRLHDYSHLRRERGPGVRAWVLSGREVGRGPDNEPLIACDEAVATVDDAVMEEAERLIDSQGADAWGPLDRESGSRAG
ncbi:DUF6098 family protein [Planomonospora parontospora]|uniref:DUF6098 family protein n=1 Tax=Planomonospora parontospora TaxID=58119 RepID=UPI00166FF6C7|nr:DUF6098 family protein [Planomonospora parontospora]GGL23959.1 hypothetical protein GCM10014719_27090 [Planomonospora parontospora subsp. antibiotica]GII15071.1 hypothetical protein Ppa05_17970 [Planomonospora parontospora subsp. antibiotica]